MENPRLRTKKRRVNEDEKRNAVSTKRTKKSEQANRDNSSCFPVLDLPVDILIEIVKLIPVAQWPSLESVNSKFRLALIGSDECGIRGAWRLIRKIDLEEDFILNRDGFKKDPVAVWRCLLEKLLLRSPNVAEIIGFKFITEFGCVISLGTPAPLTESIAQFFETLGQFESLKRISFADSAFYVKDILTFLRTSDSRGCLREVDISYNINPGRHELKTIDLGNDSVLKLEKLWCRDIRLINSLDIGYVTNLTTLNLEDTWIDSDSWIPIIERVDRLQRLDFAAPNPLCGTSAAVCKDLFHAIGALASKNLFSLGISDITFFHHDQNVSDQVLAEFEQLFEACGQRDRLKELSLSGMDGIDSQIIDAVGRSLMNLESLKMEVCDENVTPSLVNLMARVRKLKKLELNFDTSIQGSYRLTAEVVAAIATNLEDLESLSLICGRSILSNLTCLGALENLKRIYLKTSRIDSTALKAWANGFGSKLESLELILDGHFGECERKGYIEGLTSLIKKSRSLRCLQLSGFILTSRHLQIIADSCLELRELYISFSPSPYRAYEAQIDLLSESQAIADKCIRLKRFQIDVKNCKRLDYSNIKVAKYRKINFGAPKCDKLPFGGE